MKLGSLIHSKLTTWNSNGCNRRGKMEDSQNLSQNCIYASCTDVYAEIYMLLLMVLNNRGKCDDEVVENGLGKREKEEESLKEKVLKDANGS